MNTNQSATMYESVPVVSELNKVQGFDPLKFLRRTTKGEKVLDLKYKKLWFRLKYPNGRIKLSSLKITDQLAIIEARVYFDKNDAQPRSSFIAQREAKATLGGLYIESAQHAAIDQALSDAGFGVQFSAAAPAVNAEKAAETVKEQTTVAETATTEQVTPAAPVTVAEVATEVNNELRRKPWLFRKPLQKFRPQRSWNLWLRSRKKPRVKKLRKKPPIPIRQRRLILRICRSMRSAP